MASDTFDAVLADMLGESTLFLHEITDYHTRLAAAHAAEVAERDEELALAKLTATHEAEYANKMRARAEAAERDARRLDFIEDADNAADIGIYGITVGAKNLRERIDAAIATTEQAAGGLVRDGGDARSFPDSQPG